MAEEPPRGSYAIKYVWMYVRYVKVRTPHPPPPCPEMTCGFIIQLVFCKKKTMLFIGVEFFVLILQAPRELKAKYAFKIFGKTRSQKS